MVQLPTHLLSLYLYAVFVYYFVCACIYEIPVFFVFFVFVFLYSFLLQYFDTVGWVFWRVKSKTVSHITYTVLEGM